MPALACVGSFPSRAVAKIARCALMSEGIEATVSAEDSAYDITVARGGARLLVEVNSIDAARQILTTLESRGDDSAATKPLRYSLRALFVLTTQVAFTAAGYAVGGFDGAVHFSLVPITAIIGVQILLSLKRRRPIQRFFVAIAGVGFLIGALVSLLNGLFA